MNLRPWPLSTSLHPMPAALLLCMAALGCHHRQYTPPPPVLAPIAHPQTPVTPSTITVITPLPSVPPTTEPSVQPASAAPPPEAKAAKTPRRRRHLRKTKEPEAATQTTAAPSTQPPAASHDEKHPADAKTSPSTAPAQPGMYSIDNALSGQWSTGTAISGTQRTDLLDAISRQEKRIRAIPEAKKPEVASVLLQVRSFLMKARAAVANNDMDGAQTLNMKAQVLLDELQEGQ